MARKPPGEARTQTRKARKAAGNPRKAKASSDLVANGQAAGVSAPRANDPRTNDPRARRNASRQGLEEQLDLIDEGLSADDESESPGQGQALEQGFGPDRGLERAIDSVGSEDPYDSEELGTQPNPSIKTEGQIKRAAKAVQKIEKERRRKIARNVMLAIIGVILIALIVLSIIFAIHRWNTYSDEADIQGTWYVEKTDLPIVITADKIELTDGVAYSYKLDPDTKTIEFKFGNMVGQGRYRFSLDRQQLSIMDGEYGYWDTLMDDVAWTIQAVIRDLQGLPQLNPGIEGSMISEGTLTLLKKPNEESSEGSLAESGDQGSSLLDGADAAGSSGAGEGGSGGAGASGADSAGGEGTAGQDGTSAGGSGGTGSGSGGGGGSGGSGGNGLGSTQLDVKDL